MRTGWIGSTCGFQTAFPATMPVRRFPSGLRRFGRAGLCAGEAIHLALAVSRGRFRREITTFFAFHHHCG